jgi:hypothetical protein
MQYDIATKRNSLRQWLVRKILEISVTSVAAFIVLSFCDFAIPLMMSDTNMVTTPIKIAITIGLLVIVRLIFERLWNRY